MINIHNLRKDYGNFSLQVDQFQLCENTITGIVGINGAGKSTLFKAICGLIKSDAGDISLFGSAVDDLSVEQKEKLGVIFSDSTFPTCLTIRDCRHILKSAYPSFNEKQFDQMCADLELPDGKPLSGFSTGMMARFKLIATITHDARLLILDEPTAGLDILARNKIYEYLQDFMEKPGRSILISSHIASDLENLCDDFWMIHHGQFMMHETVDALKNEYGILSVDEKTFETIDPVAIVGYERKPSEIKVLVKNRKFYEENYPGIVVTKGNIDDLLTILEKGERLQ